MDRKPPSPPLTHPLLGHLHELRREGYVAFFARCVAEYGPIFLLRFGPAGLGRRFLVVTDPATALLTLRQDLARDYSPLLGPPTVFGADSVFCTAGDTPLHAARRALIADHLGGAMLSRHAMSMQATWRAAIPSIVAMPPEAEQVDRCDFNDSVLRVVQRVALRCWMGVDATDAECQATLDCYEDPGRLLSEPLFNSFFFWRARARIAGLIAAYRPVLARSLASEDPGAAFVSRSLAALDWDRARLAVEPAYRRSLLQALPFYQHLFNVMLPAVGSTGGTILFLMRALAENPAVQEALRAELAAADFIARPQPTRLMAMAIRECLRLHPPAAAIARRLREDRVYGGYDIPKGTHTLVQLHSLHRNPASYADPDRFDPERFSARDAAAGGRFAGFSLGAMACTGQGFAELQIALVFQELLAKVRLHASGPAPAHNDYQGSVTLQPAPFAISFERLHPTNFAPAGLPGCVTAAAHSR